MNHFLHKLFLCTKGVIFIALLFFTKNLKAQEVVVQQGFENAAEDTWAFSPTPASYNASNDVWAAVNQVGNINALTGAFWGMRDLQNPISDPQSNGLPDHTITFDPIDISNYIDVTLSFNYNTTGFDTVNGDQVFYEIIYDADALNGNWQNADVVELNGNTGAWEEVTINIEDRYQNIAFRILARQDGGSDYAGVDNVLLQGVNQGGEVNQPSLVITEIMYNDPALGNDDQHEFVEIYNDGNQNADLSNYTLEGLAFTIPNGTNLASGEYLVIAKSAAVMQRDFAIQTLEFPAGQGLSNGGETLRLLDAEGNTIDEVTYSDRGQWPVEADGTGPSLVLCDPNADNNDPTNWALANTATGVFANGTEILANPNADCNGEQDEDPDPPVGGITEISVIRALIDVNGALSANDEGDEYTVQGTIHGINTNPTGLQFTIIDNTAGIGLYLSDQDPQPQIIGGQGIQEGDEVTLTGILGQYNGLMQLRPTAIDIESSGNNRKNPVIVNVLDESSESDLVQLENVTIQNPAAWVGDGSGFNINIELQGSTYILRVDDDTELSSMTYAQVFGGNEVTEGITIIGIGGQYDRDSPFVDGYQILPYKAEDIFINQPEGNFITLSLSSDSGSEVDETVITLTARANEIVDADYTITISVEGFAGTDYDLPQGNEITILNGQQEGTIAFQVVNDEEEEGRETGTISISAVSEGIAIGNPSFRSFTIEDDDLIFDGNCNPPANLSGLELRTWLKENCYDGFFNNISPGGQYSASRSAMYNNANGIDNQGGEVICVYTGYADDVNSNTYPNPVNTEHSIPQSWFGRNEPMVGDIHHLFPTHGDVNGERSNHPFDEINDNVTDIWFIANPNYTTSGNIPVQNIDLYSEKGNGANLGRTAFEPREDHKGNLARAVFYFYTVYPNAAGNIAQIGDINVLYQWHLNDPADQAEIERNTNVEAVQGNRNFYIDDPNLVARAWGLGVDCNPPVAPIVNLQVANLTATSVELTWQSNSNTIILITGEGAVNATPLDGENYSASASYENGDALGNAFVAYAGNGNQMTISGLNPESEYFVTAVPYSCLPADYFVENPASVSFTTEQVVISPIADVRNNVGGLGEIGTEVTIRGVIHGVNLNPNNNGLQFTIIDATHGIGIYNSSNGNDFGALIEGDQVLLTGIVDEYNGLMQLNPTSILVESQGNPRSNPISTELLNEDTESNLVILEEATVLDPTQWLGNVQSFNLDVSVGGNNIVVRIDGDTELASMTYAEVFGGNNITEGITIIGLGGQFDNAAPFDEGYQILPYRAEDIFVPGEIAPSIVGNGLLLDGATSVLVPGDVDLNITVLHNFSFELWFRNDVAQNEDALLFSSNGIQLGYRAGSEELFLELQDSEGNQVNIKSRTQIKDEVDNWHCVSIVLFGDKLFLYLDGAIEAEGSLTNLGAINIGFGDITLGKDWIDDSNYFKGKIDEFRVWAKSLQHYEILQNLFNVMNGNEDNLQAYLNFDEENGIIVPDRTGNFYDGEITGLVSWIPTEERAAAEPIANNEAFSQANNWRRNRVPVENVSLKMHRSTTVDQNFTANHLYVEDGTTLTINAGTVLTVNGNLLNNGVIQGEGHIRMQGKYITGGNFSELRIAQGQGVELQGDATVDNLILLSGKLDIKSNDLSITTNLATSSVNNYIVTSSVKEDEKGFLIRNISDNPAQTQAFLVGTEDSYLPVSMLNSGEAGLIKVRVLEGLGEYEEELSLLSVNKRWEIKSEDNVDVNITFQWNQGLQGENFDPESVVVYKINEEGIDFFGDRALKDLGDGNFITNIENIRTFSDVIVSSGGVNILPVSWVDFEGAVTSINTVKLTWITAQETNNDHFVVQKSNDGFNFKKIGQIEGAGNKSSLSQYEFEDQSINSGLAYYRLKQVDFDGNFEYSKIISVDIYSSLSESSIEIKLFPNPLSGNDLNIYAKGFNSNQVISFNLINTLGQVIMTDQFFANGGGVLLENIDFETIAGSDKVFFLQLQTSEKIMVRQIVR